MKKYHIFKIDPSEIMFGIILGILFGVLSAVMTYTNKSSLILSIVISFITTVISSILSIIIFSIRKNNKKITNLPNNMNDEIFKLINTILYYSEATDKELKDKKMHDIYYLKAINALTGKTLEFDPDDASLNALHKVAGTISITAAAPREWLNPTYNFFLINNYISSLKHRVNLHKGKKIMKFTKDREEPIFKSFINRKKEIIKTLSELNVDNPSALKDYLSKEKISIRFYFLSHDEIQSNKSILEALVAGHELFGCYLYIVNERAFPQVLKDFLAGIGYDLSENDNRTDLMIAQRDNTIDVIFKSGNNLIPKELSPVNQILAQRYVKNVGQYVYTNYNDDQYYPSNFNFKPNEQYPHAYIEHL